MREAERAGYAYLFQLVFHLRQLGRETGGVLRRREIRVRPGVVADLESHLVDFRDLRPGHEVFAVVHPAMSDEEGRLKSEVLQQRGHEGAMRFDGIVKGEDDCFRRDAGAWDGGERRG